MGCDIHAPPRAQRAARAARSREVVARVCFKQMVRKCPFDTRRSLIDLIADWTRTQPHNARNRLERLVDKGVVPEYDRVTIGKGPSTPVVTDEQWAYVQSHLPRTQLQKAPDDLYVMKYSNRDDVVKIGRSHNVENRRRSLEQGHAFYISVVAVFPGCGHYEQQIHQRLDLFRSRGAGREWFRITSDQALETVHWFIGNPTKSLCAQVVEVRPD